MPGLEDWTNNPLGIIQSIYDKNGSADSQHVREYFGKKTESETSKMWIPSLNDTPLHCLPCNSLVRYRCMVQDMFDPEFYLGEYEVTDINTKTTAMKSGKYKDIAECPKHQEINTDSQKNVTMERQTLYCVPIPGETEWVKKILKGWTNPGPGCTGQTKIAEGHLSANYADQAGKCGNPSSSHFPVRSKRGLEEEGTEAGQEMDQEAIMDMAPLGNNDTPNIEAESKKPRTGISDGSNPGLNTDLNFPLPGEKGISCLVKIYEDIEGFAVNDMVEFIGVLSVDPTLAHFHEDNRSDGIQSSIEDYEEPMEERNAHAPPPSLVPRLHAILYHKLKHNNPLVSTVAEKFQAELTELESEISVLRKQILSALEHVMLGDTLAAEYFLCHLICSVYARADVMPIGKFSLNLTLCPATSEFGQLLHTFMTALVTKSYLLPLSIENMNSLRLCPEKDYTANRLKSGVLQLSSDTNLVVDETHLKPGQLESTGVKNVTALGNLISWQKVEYDFSFHRQDFLSNVAVLIISEAKSILPSDCMLPVHPTSSLQNLHHHFSQLDSVFTPEFLQKFRTYITLCKQLEYTISDTMQKAIQDDFVDMRKEDPKAMTVDDFHTLLNLVRLLSLTALETSPSESTWQKAKHMEMERKRRILQTTTTSR